MTTSLTELRACVAEFLEDSTSGLEIYRHVPASIEAPAVIVRPVSQTRSTMRRGFVRTQFALICVAALNDTVTAQDTLDEMLALDGDRSIIAAFDTAPGPIGPDVDADVGGWDDYDTRQIGETDYLSASIELVLHSKGNAS